MDSKATFTSSRSRRRQIGATISEVVVAGGIAAALMAVFVSFIIYQGRSFTLLFHMADVDQQNRNALDRMTQEVRQVKSVSYYGTNYVEFLDYDNVTLTYRYSAGAGTLTRTKSGQTSTVLLSGLVSFTFTMMQRNIVEGSYAYYPAESTAECKVLGLTWETARAIMGKKAGFSGTQMARIVIRKA